MGSNKKEKSLFKSAQIRLLFDGEQVLARELAVFAEDDRSEISLALLPGIISFDLKPRFLFIAKEILNKILSDHGMFTIENLIITLADWDYVLQNVKGDPDRINLIKKIPNSNNFFVVGAKRINGFFMLTYFEYSSKYGNELKNLLEKGDALDRSGRTPKSTTKPLRESDSVGSSPEAITVFRPDKGNISDER